MEAQKMSSSRRATNNKELPSATAHNESRTGNDAFLKVSPNLFTAERLPLFDSLDLYTTLIRSSRALEQGERLHNLSWRIINKALLKDHDINKSKKRDGVKNLYNVINPVKNGQQIVPRKPNQLPVRSQQKPAAAVPAASLVRSSNSVATQLSHHVSQHQTNASMQPMQVMHAMQGTHAVDGGKRKSRPLQSQAPTQAPPHYAKLPHGPQNAKRGIRHTGEGDAHQAPSRKPLFGMPPKSPSPEPKRDEENPPQNVVKGFDPNTMITKKKDDKIFYIGQTPSPDGSLVIKKKLSNKSVSEGRANETASLFSQKSDDKLHALKLSNLTANGTNHPKSLFGATKPPAQHDKSNPNTKELFFSSEDDESDWNSLSDDSDFYDEEEEDQYYQKQWDKLLFSRNEYAKSNASQSNSSGTASPVPQSEKHDVKRSLLSGLFLNEMHKRPVKSITPVSSQRPTLEESSIMAVGDVTPSSSWKSSTHLDQDQAPSTGEAALRPTSSQLLLNRSKRGSFSSIISESTRQRYSHVSNAPPTAQTILPTALSTHMFVPNNVHQQRMARSNAGRSDSSLRRESMDIPSKNRNNSFLKTRMEISEEENFARAISRRI
ncbi:LAFE_0E12464g1_1 [Lachancea fermentati]|uniref:LAFE_0E12464g1_1 n=1 Tax=Lachancea fermentati TaxID=4955 RepID=A0A1G4MDM8_LACFM|nr:LAFE_0E12464g1_1 [Lachancea fermentati]